MNNGNIIDIRVTARDLASGVLKNVKGSISGVVGNSKTAQFALASLATAFTALGIAAVKAAGDFEQNQIAFEVLAGNAKVGLALLQQLEQFAKKTPFQLPELQEAAKQLLAYNFGVREIIPTLETVGNIAAGVGKDKIPILIRALGQIRAKGFLKGQELLQLTETGLPIVQTLAKNIGVSVQELNDNVSDLHIPFDTVLETIKEIEKNQFANLMDKQSKTLLGTLSNVKDTAWIILRNFGQQSGLLDAAKRAANFLYQQLNKFTSSDFFAGLVTSTRLLVTMFVNGAKGIISFVTQHKSLVLWVIKAIGAIGIMVGTVQVATKAMVFYTTFTATAAAALKGLTFQVVIARGAVGLLGLAVAYLGSLFMKFKMSQEESSVATTDLTLGLDDLMNAGIGATDAIASGYGKASDALKEFRKAVAEEKASFEEQLSDIVKNARERIATNKKSLDQETKDFEDAQKEKKNSFTDEQDKIRQETNQRVMNLEQTMKESILIGSSTYQQDLFNYKQAIEAIKKEGKQRLLNSEKIFNEETSKEAKEFKERSSELQKKIKEDEDMLNKHRNTIKSIKIQEQKDEIQILKDTHAKRLLELQEQYKKEISGAGAAGSAAGSSFGTGFNNGASAGLDKFIEDLNKTLDVAKTDTTTKMTEIEAAVIAPYLMIGALFDETLNKLTTIDNQAQTTAARIKKEYSEQKLLQFSEFNNLLRPGGAPKDIGKLIPPFARGTNNVPSDMIALVHKGEKIIPASQNPDNPENTSIKGSGVTIVNNFFNSFIDANALSSRISFELRNA